MITVDNILQIADSAMTANQTAMNTISENVANVNTPYYNSETPVMTENPAVVGSPYTYGTGVNVTQIQRTTNDFVQSEVNNESGSNSYYTTLYQGLAQIQNLFNDQSGSGFSSQISTFFNDFQNVANNPSDISQRTSLLSDASSLTGSINNAYNTMMNTVSSANTSMQGVVQQINSLTTQIATLNNQITYAMNAGSNANELQDQQAQAINSLSQLTNISYYTNSNGKTNISIGGMALVTDDNSYNLSTQVSGSNSGALNIMWNGPQGNTQSITSSITGGSLGAYVNLEQTQVPSYVGQLNSLAAAITDNVNSLQQSGYGLDGSTGNNFFTPNMTTAVGTTSSSTAVTDATISSGIVTNPANLTGDKYTITANTSGGKTTFSVYNNTTKQTLSSSAVSSSTPTINAYGQSVYAVGFDGISVNITSTATTATSATPVALGNGETFTVNQLTTDPAFTMAVNPNLTASQVAGASAVSTAVNPANTGNATISAGAVINPTDVTGGTTISGSNEGGQYNITYLSSALTAAASSGASSITIGGNFASNSNPADNFVKGQQILIGGAVYDVKNSSSAVSYSNITGDTTINLSASLGGSGYSSGATVSAFSVNNETTGNTQYLAVAPTTNSSGQNVYSINFGNQNYSGTGTASQNFNVTLTGSLSSGDSFTANVLSPSSSVTTNGSGINSSVSTPLTLSQMNAIGLQGNNGNALNLTNLQNNNLPINGSNTTVSTYYSNIVSDIGTQSQSANTNYTNSSSVLTNLQNQLQSSVGVSMNQQMTNLLNYQNSYQAAAAIITSTEAIMTALLSTVP